jgi:hypothetical protein
MMQPFAETKEVKLFDLTVNVVIPLTFKNIQANTLGEAFEKAKKAAASPVYFMACLECDKYPENAIISLGASYLKKPAKKGRGKK